MDGTAVHASNAMTKETDIDGLATRILGITTPTNSLAIRAAKVLAKDAEKLTELKNKADTAKTKKAREAAQAIYESAALAAAARAQEEKKKRREEEIAAILLLLLLAGEDAYRKTYSTLGTEGLKSFDETQIKEQAITFAQGRQKDLKEFSDKLHDALELTKSESEKENLTKSEMARALRETAKKVSANMTDIETTITLGSVELDRLKRAGFRTVFWSQVDRPTKRESHTENQNQGVVPLGTTFPSGQKYPGDPAGGVGECVNCLCVLVGVEREK